MAIRKKKSRGPGAGREPSIAEERPQPRISAERFPVVGIGASAGGLEAVSELLSSVPENTGLAFVVIIHQDATHPSSLPHIFSRVTAMPVHAIQGGETLEPNHVYVAPHARVLLDGNRLILIKDGDTRDLPIHAFFRSLAEARAGGAIAVVLSGAASDGSAGLKAIKSEGGITFAQDSTAKFDSMPRNAVASGAVDFVLSPSEVASELARIARDSYTTGGQSLPMLPPDGVARLFSMLQRSHNIDFSHYKAGTVERRIRRRMTMQKIETLDDYLKLVRDDPPELDALYNDILIRVTNFFRDPAVFEALKTEVFPTLFKEENQPLRVWVPGCATGEEVYSIAIVGLEAMEAARFTCPIQIFGTDVSDAAIEQARAGLYSQTAVADVDKTRLHRFFTATNGSFQVSKTLRDCCIFAKQNVTKDLPFSRLDLISCRNVMIYLGAPLQRKVMNIFHYALKPTGYLLLGNSETVGNFADLFGIADRKHKIYQKKYAAGRIGMQFEPARPQPKERGEKPMEHDLPAADGLRTCFARLIVFFSRDTCPQEC